MDGRKALAARDEWSPTADVFRSMHVSSLRSWLVINCNGRAKKLRLGQDCEKCGLVSYQGTSLLVPKTLAKKSPGFSPCGMFFRRFHSTH
jgi:hypothetical protein